MDNTAVTFYLNKLGSTDYVSLHKSYPGQKDEHVMEGDTKLDLGQYSHQPVINVCNYLGCTGEH